MRLSLSLSLSLSLVPTVNLFDFVIVLFSVITLLLETTTVHEHVYM